MATIKKMILNNEKGFVLLLAVIACLILVAISVLVMNMTAGNLFSSSETVGNKKAFSAVESGVQEQLLTFQPGPETWTTANNYTQNCAANIDSSGYIWQTITDASNSTTVGVDSNTVFSTCQPAQYGAPVPSAGGGFWCRYTEEIIGRNTLYNSVARVGVGIKIWCPTAGLPPGGYQ